MELRRRQPDRRARALRQAESIALFFPDVRPRGRGIDAIVAELTDAADRLPTAYERLPEAERRRIVESWTTRYPKRWTVLVREAGDVHLAERALVAGALSCAVGDRKPCDPAGLAEIEAAPDVHPGNALAAVIPPSTVWEYELAVEAARAGDGGDRDQAIAAIGFGHFTRCRRRLLERVAWVRGQLPFPSFPGASAVLHEGCDLVATRRRFDEELACAVLEGYVRLLEDGFPDCYITASK